MKYDIYITGDITDESFVIFSKKLSRLEEDTSLKTPISIMINSYGGEAFAALSYFDRIQGSKHKINITATGFVASAAVLVLAAGYVRYITPSTWVMVHEDSVIIKKNMSVSKAEKEVEVARRLENQWSALLASVTKTSIDKWNELHKNETYLTANECLELGLVDELK